MIKVLILGRGYVGSYIHKKLEEVGNDYLSQTGVLVESVARREFDYVDINLLDEKIYCSDFKIRAFFARYDYVINCSGFTGRPNVDQGEKEPGLCYELNTFAPLRVSNICQIRNINYIHISSGCIYTGYGKAWEEDDEPNFGLLNEESSTYSKSKHAYELASDYGLTLRVRMPFCDTLHERSYLTKILNYDNLINLVNSKTYIPQLVDFIAHLITNEKEAKEKDTVNFVQPNALSTDKVTEIMTDYNLQNSKWNWVPFEELGCIANRSNCVLSTDKLKEKYSFELLDEEVAIHQALTNIIKDE